MSLWVNVDQWLMLEIPNREEEKMKGTDLKRASRWTEIRIKRMTSQENSTDIRKVNSSQSSYNVLVNADKILFLIRNPKTPIYTNANNMQNIQKCH